MIKKLLRKLHLIKDPNKKKLIIKNGSISSKDLTEVIFSNELETEAKKENQCVMCLIVKNPVNGKILESRKVVPKEMMTKIIDLQTNGSLSDLQLYNMVSKFFEDR